MTPADFIALLKKKKRGYLLVYRDQDGTLSQPKWFRKRNRAMAVADVIPDAWGKVAVIVDCTTKEPILQYLHLGSRS